MCRCRRRSSPSRAGAGLSACPGEVETGSPIRTCAIQSRGTLRRARAFCRERAHRLEAAMNHRIVWTPAIALLAGAPSHAQTFRAAAGAFAAETLARGRGYPWRLALLPDGRTLVPAKR